MRSKVLGLVVIVGLRLRSILHFLFPYRFLILRLLSLRQLIHWARLK